MHIFNSLLRTYFARNIFLQFLCNVHLINKSFLQYIFHTMEIQEYGNINKPVIINSLRYKQKNSIKIRNECFLF